MGDDIKDARMYTIGDACGWLAIIMGRVAITIAHNIAGKVNSSLVIEGTSSGVMAVSLLMVGSDGLLPETEKPKVEGGEGG